MSVTRVPNFSCGAVKRKHLENVPERMTEAEFWTRFFQSHYFHRDRLHTATRDLFSDCARSDDQGGCTHACLKRMPLPVLCAVVLRDNLAIKFAASFWMGSGSTWKTWKGAGLERVATGFILSRIRRRVGI